MTLDTNPPMTIEAFEAFLRSPGAKGHEYWELVEGRLIERGNTQEIGVIVVNIIFWIVSYARERKQGRGGPSIWHHKAGDLYDVRMPKFAYYVDHTRPIVEEGFVPVYPDLAVEIIAPHEPKTAIAERGAFYLSRGTKVVWLVYPAAQKIDVMTADGVQTLTGVDMLTGGDVLPGFSVSVAEIFQLDPSAE